MAVARLSLARALLLSLPYLDHAIQQQEQLQQQQQQPLPICSSCEDYCAGRCSLRGPRGANGEQNPRVVQNITLYRMTAANVTDLVNKDTGDAAGDLVFNMGERARPMECRHGSQTGASSMRQCNGGSTQSWLLKSSLVYLEWIVEVDGNWGPYQPCNLNITGRGGQPGDHRWHCGPPRVLLKDNVTDAELCKTCPRAAAAVGWEDQNHSTAAYEPQSSAPTAACNHTATQLCAGHMGNFSSCKQCLSLARTQLKTNGCSYSKLLEVLCPRPPTPSASCAAAAQEMCGLLRQPQLRHNCSRCLESNRSRAAIRAACGQLGEQALLYSHWCPLEPKPNYNANTTFIKWRPNPRLISEKLGGSWFSTPGTGQCTGHARPGDGSGCTWRPVQLQKAVNYTCLQGNVAAAVMDHNPQCFSGCADGAERNPRNATDCWLTCFFNTFLGNVTLGIEPMEAEPVLTAWAASFAHDNTSMDLLAAATANHSTQTVKGQLVNLRYQYV